ncbi:MAG TPA: hypothetical protein VIR29_06865 [Anseongella sp.]
MSSKEKQLVILLRGEGNMEGAMDAFGQLYEQYHGVLYRSALRFVKSDELAREQLSLRAGISASFAALLIIMN